MQKVTRKNKSFEDLITWISGHNSFIDSIFKGIKKKRTKVNIIRSYQLEESTNLLNKMLLSFEIDSKILDHNTLFTNTKISKDAVNLIFFSERDIGTFEIFLEEITKIESNNFLVISKKQKTKVKFKCNSITFLSDHTFINRNLQIMMIAHELLNKFIEKNKDIIKKWK